LANGKTFSNEEKIVAEEYRKTHNNQKIAKSGGEKEV